MKRAQLIWTVALVASASGVALAQAPKPSAVSVITEPDWLRKPTPEALQGAFPKGATASEGLGRITCLVSVQGLLRDCKVSGETPEGQGFGGAALAIAPQLLFRPATRDGKPFEASVTVPINFKCFEACGNIARGGRALLNGLNWAQAPSQAEMVAAYPPKAKEKHILGVASIQCELTAAGSLKNCDTMSEEPKGQGFGRAAASLAKYFQKPTNVAPDLKMDGAFTRLTFTFGEQMYDGAPYVAKPRFTAAPSGGDLMDAYRAAAPKADEIETGEATVKCTIVEAGALADCALLKETPAGKGVGKAVLAVAPKFKLATWTDDGLPVIGTSVRLPIKFNVKDPPNVEPATATNAP